MRLFIALCLPEDAVSQIIHVQGLLPTGRLTPEENLHVTVCFVGETTPRECESILEALESIQQSAVTLTLSGAQVFGGKGGQAVALQADGGGPLLELHTKVRSRLHGAGLPLERRRFRPHVTLARLPGRADPAGLVSVLNGIHKGPFVASQFGLFQSTLHPDGAQYEPIEIFDLPVVDS